MVSNQKPRRIVFYRIGAIGDIIHGLPLLKLVKDKNPTASIEIMVGSKQVADLLKVAATYIDKVWCVSHKGPFDKPLSRQNPNQSEKDLLESIKVQPIDELVFLHSNFIKANLINIFFLKAKKLIIYKNKKYLSATVNYTTTYFPELEAELVRDPYAVLDYRTLEVQAVIATAAPTLAVTAKQPPCANYIGIVLGVGNQRPSRAYPLAKWLQLIDEILLKTNSEIYIFGGPDELELSKEFESLIEKYPQKSRIKNLIGKTSLLDLAEILSGVSKLYSGDTGILHIAAALDLPIEAVFTITSDKRFGPFNPNAKIIKAGDCPCEAQKDKLKHCQNIVDAYAKCAWNCTFQA